MNRESSQEYKNKVIVAFSENDDDPANFQAKFHQPLSFPIHSQVRLINCRINLDDNDIIINETNRFFNWGLGYAWSNPTRASSGFPVFNAKIETGIYRTTTGSTREFITNLISPRSL